METEKEFLPCCVFMWLKYSCKQTTHADVAKIRIQFTTTEYKMHSNGTWPGICSSW